MCAIYAHPLEHLLCNLLPIIITGYLFRLDWICFNIWLVIVTINTLITHSDYKLIGKEHDYHHKYRTCNYGTSVIMDYLLGTLRLD